MEALLKVENLQVDFTTYAGVVKAVNNVSFSLNKGEVLGLVGESGCGKSVTANALMRLVPMPPGRFTQGSINFAGKEILKLSEKDMRSIRGNEISMIFQDPMTCLNPVITIGAQLIEGLVLHRGLSKKESLEQAVTLLETVGISSAQERLRQYPHELSGGMRQRVMIAMALGCKPRLLIADEPTTALDVTIQAQIMDLIKKLNRETDTAVILITHDLGVVAGVCKRVLVMYAGSIVESATVDELYAKPCHPYTWALLRSVPRMDKRSKQLQSIEGKPPDLLKPPAGCCFMPRCIFSMDICREMPPLAEVDVCEENQKLHAVRCWLWDKGSPHNPEELLAKYKADDEIRRNII